MGPRSAVIVAKFTVRSMKERVDDQIWYAHPVCRWTFTSFYARPWKCLLKRVLNLKPRARLPNGSFRGCFLHRWSVSDRERLITLLL